MKKMGIVIIIVISALAIYFFSKEDKKEAPTNPELLESSSISSVQSAQNVSNEESSVVSKESERVGNGDPKTNKQRTKKRKLISDLLVITGTKDQFLSIDQMLELQLNHQLQKISTSDPSKLETTEQVFEIIKSSLKGEDLLKQFEKDLEKSFSASELEELKGLYSTPEMLNFSEKANLIATSPHIQVDLQNFMKNNGFEHTSKHNKEAINEIIEKSKAVEITSEMATGTVKNIFKGTSHINSKNKKQQEEYFQKSLTEVDKVTKLRTRLYYQNMYAFLFKGLSKAEIDSIVKVSTNPLADRLNKVSLRAMRASMMKAGEKIGKELTKESDK